MFFKSKCIIFLCITIVGGSKEYKRPELPGNFFPHRMLDVFHITKFVYSVFVLEHCNISNFNLIYQHLITSSYRYPFTRNCLRFAILLVPTNQNFQNIQNRKPGYSNKRILYLLAYFSVSTKLLALPKGVKHVRIFIEATLGAQKEYEV